ncbi:translation initiation factor IF-2-like [Meles meles]|uniref:translation initiation factor IF-2-like n=1 Tax=Meles meles TaxID=9662 RepID=UPI001E69D18A|nr:translation initiation factor IF-2-like [Meles meles]
MSIYGDLSERRAPIGSPGRDTWGPRARPRPPPAPPPTAPPAPPPRAPDPARETPRVLARGRGGPEPPGIRGPGCGSDGPAPPRDCWAVGEGPAAPRNCLAQGSAAPQAGCVPAARPHGWGALPPRAPCEMHPEALPRGPSWVPDSPEFQARTRLQSVGCVPHYGRSPGWASVKPIHARAARARGHHHGLLSRQWGGPGAPNSPRDPRRRAGEGRARLPLPRCVTGGGTARCGRRCAAGGGGARGAVRPYLAIWAPREPRPPPGKPRPGQPRPRPPPALSHRPGGGGSNGRGAPGALLALFSQGGRRLAGGTKGRWRAAGAGAEGASPSPAPTPGCPRPRGSAAGPAATVGGGAASPVAAGGGGDAGLEARPGPRGVTALLGSSTGSLGRVDAVGPGSRMPVLLHPNTVWDPGLDPGTEEPGKPGESVEFNTLCQSWSQ